MDSSFLKLQIKFCFIQIGHSLVEILSFVWTSQFSTWANLVNHNARYPYVNFIDGIEQQTNKVYKCEVDKTGLDNEFGLVKRYQKVL